VFETANERGGAEFGLAGQLDRLQAWQQLTEQAVHLHPRQRRRLKYCYNFLGIEYYTITAEVPIPTGQHQVRMAFTYDGGGPGKGGEVTLYYDGKPVGTGRVDRTEPMIYSADEACDVGADTGSPSSPDYGPTDNKFNGESDWVQIDLGADSHDHLIKPEDRLTIAMARQ
jgi:hypothetical protein